MLPNAFLLQSTLLIQGAGVIAQRRELHALHEVDLGSIPRISYGSPSLLGMILSTQPGIIAQSPGCATPQKNETKNEFAKYDKGIRS